MLLFSSISIPLFLFFWVFDFRVGEEDEEEEGARLLLVVSIWLSPHTASSSSPPKGTPRSQSISFFSLA